MTVDASSAINLWCLQKNIGGVSKKVGSGNERRFFWFRIYCSWSILRKELWFKLKLKPFTAFIESKYQSTYETCLFMYVSISSILKS